MARKTFRDLPAAPAAALDANADVIAVDRAAASGASATLADLLDAMLAARDESAGFDPAAPANAGKYYRRASDGSIQKAP